MSEFNIIDEDGEEKLVESLPNYEMKRWGYKSLEAEIAMLERHITELTDRKFALEAELLKMTKPIEEV